MNVRGFTSYPCRALSTRTERIRQIQQLAQLPRIVEATVNPKKQKTYQLRYSVNESQIAEAVAVPAGKRNVQPGHTLLLSYEGKDAVSIQLVAWRTHPEFKISSFDEQRLGDLRQSIWNSWSRCFDFSKVAAQTRQMGLRPPQMGAVHALHSHWTVSNDTATVVMPTGTGKSDTMIAAMLSAKFRSTLVVVPTDALRTQLSRKFLELGILRTQGVVDFGAQYPLVARLERIPRAVEEFRLLLQSVNVVVTTMSIAAQCTGEIQNMMAETFDALFVDEAHHVGAITWGQFVGRWNPKKVVQFTATPFRNDGKEVARHPVYVYPLALAQKDGFFRPIEFNPVAEFDSNLADRAIAVAATTKLKEDLKKYKHVLMARVSTVDRASQVLSIYKDLCPELNPIELHVGVKGRERSLARGQILSGRSSIVVCVDMLGEGFDLPNLKVAAFHDIRKNLTTTLQLAGRFVRDHHDVGNASVFANIADPRVEDELELLYQQDSDWNLLLPRFSASSIAEVADFAEFLNGFSGSDTEIDLGNLRPSFSTVVFRVPSGKWRPELFLANRERFGDFALIKHRLQKREKVLVMVAGATTLPKCEILFRIGPESGLKTDH